MRENSMSDNYKIIDEKTWERAMHCAVFRVIRHKEELARYKITPKEEWCKSI